MASPLDGKNVSSGAVSAEAEGCQQSPDDLVMGTNSSSIVSKRSVERLYYPDEPHFFRFFVNKFQRRAPLINRGYYLRLKVIDTVVRQFLEQPSTRPKVVVNLGCGSDVLPWQCHTRYPDLCQNVLFVDIDFPDLMEKKRQVVLATPELQDLLGSYITGEDGAPVLLRSDRYCQVGCDLRQRSLVQEILSDLIQCSTSEADFLFVAEVSITYLETGAADDIIQWASSLGNSQFCLLEQLLPDGPGHPFAVTMLKHFEKLKTPLRSVFQYPTLESQESRFQSRGWPDTKALTLWQTWADPVFLDSSERQRLDDVEPFDEWEELALFASHYVVVIAKNNASFSEHVQNDGNNLAASPNDSLAVVTVPMAMAEAPAGRGQRRFGAAMVAQNVMGETYVSHILGHGSRQRLASFDMHAKNADFLASLPGPQPGGPAARVCHTLTDLGAVGTLLVGGRASPATVFGDCWLYDKATNLWAKTFDMPVPLYRQSVVRLGRSNLALVGGGRSDQRTTSNQFYVFHPEKGWLTCSLVGDTSPALFGANIVVLSAITPGCFHGLLFGGMLPEGVLNPSIYQWDLRVTDGRPIMSLSKCQEAVKENGERHSQALLSRFGAVCCEHDGRHFLFGGVGADFQIPRDFDILVFEPDSKGGLRVVARVDGRDGDAAVRPFFVGSSVTSHAKGIWSVLGGGATCFSMGTFWSKGTYTFALPARGETPDCTTQSHAICPIQYVQSAEIVSINKDFAASPGKLASSPVVESIPRVRISSTQDFQDILERGVPVVMEGANVGPCVSQWTPEYLVNSVGYDRQVSVHEAITDKMDFNNKNFEYVTKKFGDFIQEAEDQRKVYLRALSATSPSGVAANLEEDFPSLSKDFRLPPELEIVSKNTFSSVLRVSGPVNMWLHYDVMANVYAQIKGTKKLVLFHPKHVTEMGFAPGASSSSVDVFSALDQGTLGEGIRAHEAVVGPGDILYLPPLWLHTARPTEGLSVAVNVFFRSLTSGYSAGKDVYGNRDMAAYEKGQQDIQKTAKSLQKLPKDVADFYGRRLADELLRSVGARE